MACRGTGRVISNLGGSSSTIACPWCEGSGLRPAEVDAQAHWPREQVPAQGAPEGTAEGAAAGEQDARQGVVERTAATGGGEVGGAEGPAG
jgi:hypothetical protein